MTEDSPLFHKIIALLEKSQVKFGVVDHEPVFTSEEAARVRGTKLCQGAKALVLFGDKKPLMIVVPADQRLSFSKAKKSLGIKDLRMATSDEVYNLLGVEIGSVPPFGNLEGLDLFVDGSLSKNEEIVFNPGVHIKSITIKYIDYLSIANPKLGDFIQAEIKE